MAFDDVVRKPGRTALALAYLVPFTALVGALILLGVAVDRLPGRRRATSRRYEGFLFAFVDVLGRPLDGEARGPTARLLRRSSDRSGR